MWRSAFGFSDNPVTAVGAPIALAFTPDGRLPITTQGGTLRVVQGGALLPAAALTLGSKVCANSERVLLSVAVDPSRWRPDSRWAPRTPSRN